ncbi:hypothetical protein [Variovorax soli]|uniref:hypothetical protein n=1 Tax=Variovorax soli TaxID=376815 RepID=UPI0012948487|nr:hypothetical protein [Variovorax soli]
MTEINTTSDGRPAFGKVAKQPGSEWRNGDRPTIALLPAFRAIARRAAAFFSLNAASNVAMGRVQKEYVSSAPSPLTELQARLVLSLAKLQTRDKRSAARLVGVFTPSRFTTAQAASVMRMLELAPADFCVALADFMHPCALRDRLRAGDSSIYSCETDPPPQASNAA